jgi:hypothetical protein
VQPGATGMLPQLARTQKLDSTISWSKAEDGRSREDAQGD